MSAAPAFRLPTLLGGEPAVMGIVNVTPDSFSDGGHYAAAEAAVARALACEAEGAAIVDIGGESTRPGFTPIGAEEELARVLPVLDGLAGRIGIPVSIDTTKPAVAREALRRGARIVNDIWGLQGDPAMADAVADAGAALVAMHNRHAVDAALDMREELPRFFERSLAIAQAAGIAAERIVLDPGIGFGKTAEQQVAAIRAIPGLRRQFGLPVLVGISRKSLLALLTGAPSERRLPETIGANLAAFVQGATLFRVHDVQAHVAALAVFRALGGA